jgi:hypothetical protein
MSPPNTANIIPHARLPEEVRVSRGISAMQIVPDRRVRTSTKQQLHHGKMPLLTRHMQRGDTLAMSKPAEGSFVIDGRPVIDQPRGRLHPVAPGGPD